jgi:hypothetical protein
MIDISQLPGSELIQQGLHDLSTGRESQEACLISIAQGRLARYGIPCAQLPHIPEPEHRLYHLLCQQPGDAYPRYNALLRRLISFEQALSHQHTRAQLQLS